MNTPTADLLIIPGSPALLPELAPHDTASRQLAHLLQQRCAQLSGPVEVVCSRDQRWFTAHTGSFRAWGAPEVNVGEGNYLGELVARYFLGDVPIHSVRDTIGRPSEAHLTCVVIDGPAGLTERAPLALLPGAVEQHQQCKRLLSGESTEAFDTQSLLHSGICEPQLWRELAGLKPSVAQLLAADDALGVGRYIATWKVRL